MNAPGAARAGPDVELIHHSDAGSQYTSFDYTQELDDYDVLASIGSVSEPPTNIRKDQNNTNSADRLQRLDSTETGADHSVA